MRAVLVADSSFAVREHAMLTRLETGLVAEGTRVVRAVPRDCAGVEASALHVPVVTYERGLFSSSRRRHVADLAMAVADALEGSAGRDAAIGSSGGVDVVHCFGAGAWEIAVELARQTGAGLAVEVWSAETVRRAPSLLEAAGGRVVLLAPDQSIAAATERAVRASGAPGAVVSVAPWGVHADEGTTERDRGGVVSVAVLAGSCEPWRVEGILRAIAQSPGGREFLLFMDGEAARRCGVWRHAKHLGLLDRLSIVGCLESLREPLMQVDLLLQPASAGEHRSLTLDAMAAGVLVLAEPDPLVEAVAEGRAVIVGTTDSRGAAAAWKGAVEATLADTDRAERIRQSARAWVRAERSVSGQVGAVLGAYRRVARAAARV